MREAWKRNRGLMWAAAALLVFGVSHVTWARTIELQGDALSRAAVISRHAPRAGWAGHQDHGNSYHAFEAMLRPSSALLIRYDLSAIPEDMRVTKAEWFLPVGEREPNEARLYVWRMLTAWGLGVCHDYRAFDPQTNEWQAWGEPGGRSPGVDRAMQPSQVISVTEAHTARVVNVTQDVSLWHRGVVPNEGWMLTVDDRGSWVRLRSPLNISDEDWTLRITYEPQ